MEDVEEEMAELPDVSEESVNLNWLAFVAMVRDVMDQLPIQLPKWKRLKIRAGLRRRLDDIQDNVMTLEEMWTDVQKLQGGTMTAKEFNGEAFPDGEEKGHKYCDFEKIMAFKLPNDANK